MRACFFVAMCFILSMFCLKAPSAVAQSNFLWIADMEEGSLADWYFPETSGIGDSGGGIFPSGKYSYFASIMEGRGTHSLAATIWTPSPIPNETSGVRAFRWKEPRENRELYFSAWFLSSRPNQTKHSMRSRIPLSAAQLPQRHNVRTQKTPEGIQGVLRIDYVNNVQPSNSGLLYVKRTLF